MKNKFSAIYKFFFLALISCLFLSFLSGPPAGNTGAPGDGTCNSCHTLGGGTQTGLVAISGITDVDNPIVPNKTYNVTVTVTLTGGASTSAGFQFVALDGNTAGSPSIGAFSNLGTNVGTAIAGSRTYVQHSGGENTYSGGKASYTFDWTAPATATNNISFYVTGNLADGSGANGDLIVFASEQNIPLPVELSDFTIRDLANKKVELTWTTLSEQKSDYFEILRSENGIDYHSLAKISAAGHSNEKLDYRFVDTEPVLNRNSFYRLKITDTDEQFAYSAIKTIQVMDFQDRYINIFPNPARNNFCLFVDYLSEKTHPNAVLRIYDQFGRVVIYDPQLDSGIKEGFNKFVVDINKLAKGQYFLSLTDGKNVLDSRSFLVTE